MPGEATQRIVLCGPYAAAGAHDPHPVTTVEGQAWCPGNPPKNPDGSPVTRAQREAAASAALVELTVEAERERLAAESIAAGAEGLAAAMRDGRTVLQAEEYAVVVDGIDCRVRRHEDQPNGPLRAPREPGEPTAWWRVHIDGTRAQEVTVPPTEQRGYAEIKTVETDARFPFTPGQSDSEDAALARARDYCVQVAHALVRMRAEQQATYDAAIEAVTRARTVNFAHPE
jgi:hypothetical protein